MSLTVTEFALRVREQGGLWGLKDADDAWAIHEDLDDQSEVMPVWVDEQSARACAVGEWAAYEPTELGIENFVNDWLPAMQEDLVWIGINFTETEQGDEVDPEELAQLLTAGG